MSIDTAQPDQLRASRGEALRKARKSAALSAERLAEFVNERTAGSAITKHAIYSYEQGKVLLSREVGHRIATALQLHPGQLLLGDPEYANSSGNTNPQNNIRQATADDRDSPPATQGLPVATRVELVIAAQRTLAPLDVLVRLLSKAKLGRVDIQGYLDVFHLLLEDTQPLSRSVALQDIHGFGDQPGNEAPYALAEAVLELHELANATLKRLIEPTLDSPTSLYEYCQTQTAALDVLAKQIDGQIKACNKRLPGVSLDVD